MGKVRVDGYSGGTRDAPIRSKKKPAMAALSRRFSMLSARSSFISPGACRWDACRMQLLLCCWHSPELPAIEVRRRNRLQAYPNTGRTSVVCWTEFLEPNLDRSVHPDGRKAWQPCRTVRDRPSLSEYCSRGGCNQVLRGQSRP
jgi:hypothetical protein